MDSNEISRLRLCLQRCLNNFDFSSECNNWIFVENIESLNHAIKRAINVWIEDPGNAADVRHISLKHLSIDKIMPRDVLAHALSFFDDDSMQNGGDIIRRLIPMTFVNKHWNKMAFAIQSRAFQLKQGYSLAKNIMPRDMYKFIRRMNPTVLCDNQNGSVTRAVLYAARFNEGLRIEEINDYALDTALIDPSSDLFKNLKTIKGSNVKAGNASKFLNDLLQLYPAEPCLKRFSVRLTGCWNVDLLDIAGLLPRALEAIPMPSLVSYNDADAYMQIALARCSTISSFVSGRECRTKFGMSVLRMLSELSTLERVELRLRDGIESGIIGQYVRTMLDNNHNMETMYIRVNKYDKDTLRSILGSKFHKNLTWKSTLFYYKKL